MDAWSETINESAFLKSPSKYKQESQHTLTGLCQYHLYIKRLAKYDLFKDS